MGLHHVNHNFLAAQQVRELLDKQKKNEAKTEDAKKSLAKKPTGSTPAEKPAETSAQKPIAPPQRLTTHPADLAFKKLPIRQALEFGNEALDFIKEKVAVKLQDPNSKVNQETIKALMTAFAGMQQVSKRGKAEGAKLKNFEDITKFAKAKFGKNSKISQKGLNTALKVLQIMAEGGVA